MQAAGQASSRTARQAMAGLVGLALAGTLAMPAFAADLTISDAYLRMVVPSRPAAGYFTLNNPTDKAMKLTGASSPACGMLMLHKSEKMNGMDMMHEVEAVPVPAHGKVTFAPGGYHMMCMKPTAAVTPGGKVPVTLTLDGESITAEFPVRGVSGK